MPSTGSKRVCVLDAGPIIHLDEIGALELLSHLGQLFIPESVAYEAGKHRPGVTAKLTPYIVEEVDAISRRLTELVVLHELDAGETAALAWAEQFGADLFVSDDKAARAAATDMGCASTGTLGVITHAADGGVMSNEAAIALLQSVPLRSTLFVTPALLQKVIATLG